MFQNIQPKHPMVRKIEGIAKKFGHDVDGEKVLREVFTAAGSGIVPEVFKCEMEMFFEMADAIIRYKSEIEALMA